MDEVAPAFTEERDPIRQSVTYSYTLTGAQLAQMRSKVGEVVAQDAATQLTEEFVKQFGQQVLAKVDMQAIANMVTARAVEELARVLVGRS